MQIEVTQAEFDTIIAALRLYGGQLAGRTEVTVTEVEEIAVNEDNPVPTSEAVYELGDRLLGIVV